jgi:hypothetical protein
MFSGTEIRKEFLSHREYYSEKEKKFRDIFWEHRDKAFRLFLKNINKEKLMVLYLEDITEVTRIVFYFKYQLQLKKNIDFYEKHIDLGMIWKTKHYFEPLLQRMRHFSKIYKSIPKEQLTQELEMVKQLQQKQEDPTVVESKLDLVLIKETTADNDTQITFQIFDFEIVGVVVLEKDLIKDHEIAPLRAYGPGGINDVIRKKEEELEEELKVQKGNIDKEDFIRQKTIANDFKKQMVLKMNKRKKDLDEEVPEEEEDQGSIKIYDSYEDEIAEKKVEQNAFDSSDKLSQSLKKIKPIKNNIFDSNPQDQTTVTNELSNTDSKANANKPVMRPRPRSLNPPPRSSGTFRNVSGRRRFRKEFKAATGDQINYNNLSLRQGLGLPSIGTFYFHTLCEKYN